MALLALAPQAFKAHNILWNGYFFRVVQDPKSSRTSCEYFFLSKKPYFFFLFTDRTIFPILMLLSLIFKVSPYIYSFLIFR